MRPKPVADDGKAGICLEQNAHAARRDTPSSTPLGVTRVLRLPIDVGERHSGVSHRKNPVTEYRRGTRGHRGRIKDLALLQLPGSAGFPMTRALQKIEKVTPRVTASRAALRADHTQSGRQHG
jgi:hypothetical protein